MSLDYREKCENDLEVIIDLFAKSPKHLSHSMKAFMGNVMPAYKLDQYRLFERGYDIAAVITWGWFNEETLDTYVNKHIHFLPSQWNNGDKLWMVDVLTDGLCSVSEFRFMIKHMHSLFPAEREAFYYRSSRSKALRYTLDGHEVKHANAS